MAYREIRILAVLLAVFIPINYARAPQKIRKGEKASKHEFPYQALVTGLGDVCTGAIIDTRHILTAAHCFYDEEGSRKPTDRCRVATGADEWASISSENIFTVESVIVHPNFKITGLPKYDIAIMKLTRQISFDDHQQPVVFSNKPYVASGTEVTFSGWGITAPNARGPPTLRKFNAAIMSLTECRAWLPHLIIANDRMCAISGNGATICSGDSGGPLMSNGELIGIAAEGSCDGDFPAIYTSVSPYLSWIRETI